MLKSDQKYCKNLALETPQDFLSMFGHFPTFYMKGLKQVRGKRSFREMKLRDKC